MTAVTEQELAAASTGRRVTLADVEGAIASEWYINAGEGVVADLFQPPVPARHPLRSLIVCVLVLHNGFMVTGESVCADPANSDAGIGRRLAREQAVKKIWPQLGYALKEELYQAELAREARGVCAAAGRLDRA